MMVNSLHVPVRRGSSAPSGATVRIGSVTATDNTIIHGAVRRYAPPRAMLKRPRPSNRFSDFDRKARICGAFEQIATSQTRTPVRGIPSRSLESSGVTSACFASIFAGRILRPARATCVISRLRPRAALGLELRKERRLARIVSQERRLKPQRLRSGNVP